MTATDARPFVSVVIPAYDEEAAIGNVLSDIPGDAVDEVIVVDNGSADDTAGVARRAGARVVHERRRGYGQACMAGIRALHPDTEIVVFLAADYSDDPKELPAILAPLLDSRADMVIGSRALGRRERGALAPHARVGNRLATFLIRRVWDVSFTDLGPFRAIRRDTLRAMRMRDTTYGWTVEMQVKAAIMGTISVEIPVRYRRRIGRSKITGTLRGTVGAGVKILGTIGYYWVVGRGGPRSDAAPPRPRHEREPVT